MVSRGTTDKFKKDGQKFFEEFEKKLNRQRSC